MNPEAFMARALELAGKGLGKTSPNPMVGAILVKDGRIVGEGYHRQAGLPHAEIEALRAGGAQARGAALYINLEPCAHFGKTPPCARALIEAGIGKVVAAMLDPNPEVNGRGAQTLRDAGIPVEVGLLEKEARKLNEAFIKWITARLPFITLKYAMTLDGKIATATGDSKWITSEKSRERVHQMRAAHDAILVGINTVIQDNPLLTSRTPNGKNPVRVILDSKLRTPIESNLMQTISEAPVWIAGSAENIEAGKKLEAKGGMILLFPDSGGSDLVDIVALCRHMGAGNITSVLVEGGARTLGSFLANGLADKVAAFVAPKLIGNKGAKGPIEDWGKEWMREALRLTGVETTLLGEDVLIEGYLR